MSGLDRMKQRVQWEGGKTSDGRNVKGKLMSFHSALWNSYQAEWITLDKDEVKKQYRCLIGPDKLKVDYDQKIISVDYDCGIEEGDTFYWERTGTHWIAYLQHFEEEAYFRSEVRRCDYNLDINDHKYWIYLRGPVETATVWRQKHQIEFNDLNYSIMFYIKKNQETLDYFSRHKKIKFDGHNWKVATTDKYSQEGLIEVYLEESFDNEMEDNMRELEIPEIDASQITPYIDGPQSLKPYDTNKEYFIKNIIDGKFVVSSSKVKINELETTSEICKIDVLTGRSGKFTISYMKDNNEICSLDVVITSL